MNTEKIGAAAGAVWNRLRERSSEGCTVSDLKRKTNGFTGDEVVAGIGWLAREGKVDIELQGRKTMLRLARTEIGA